MMSKVTRLFLWILCLLNIATPCFAAENAYVPQNYVVESRVQEFEEHLILDGFIGYPENTTAYNLNASPVIWNADAILTSLFGSAELAIDTYEPENEVEGFVSYTDTAGNSLNIHGKTSLWWETTHGDYIDALLVFDREDFSAAASQLDFTPPEKAVKTVTDALSAWGVTGYQPIKIFGLSQEYLQARYDGFMASDYVKQYPDDYAFMQGAPWTAEDECYYIEFGAIFEGILRETDHFIFERPDFTMLDDAKLIALVSASGIEMLKMNGERVYGNPTGQAEVSLLPIDDIIQTIPAKYQDIILTNDIVIDSVVLKYIGLTDLLDLSDVPHFPVWEIKGREVFQEGRPSEVRFYIDAVTGEEVR